MTQIFTSVVDYLFTLKLSSKIIIKLDENIVTMGVKHEMNAQDLKAEDKVFKKNFQCNFLCHTLRKENYNFAIHLISIVKAIAHLYMRLVSEIQKAMVCLHQFFGLLV